MKRILCSAMVLLAIVIAPRLCAAGEADEAVARVTAGLSDDSAKARKIVDTVQSTELKLDLAAGLLDRAVTFAIQDAGDPVGFQAGMDALAELDKRVPDKAAQWSTRRMELARKAWQITPDKSKYPVALKMMDVLGAAGDQAAGKGQWAAANDAFTEGMKIANFVAARRMTMEAKQHTAAAMLEAEKKVATLQAKLAESPTDPGCLGRLLEALVVDRDAPKAAAKLVTSQADEIWRTCLPLAAKDPKALPASACMELSKWYRQALIPKAGAAAKEHMLRRARMYLQAAIDKEELKDLALVDAKTAITAIDGELKQYDPVSAMLTRLKHVDLMKLADLETDATPGSWLFTKTVFSSSEKPTGTLAFPVEVTGDYALSLTFAKTKESGDVHFTFPVAGKVVGLNMHEYAERSRGPGMGPAGGWGRKRPAPSPTDPTAGTVPITIAMLNMRLEDVEDQSGSSANNPMKLDYAAHPWLPFILEVGVKIAGESVEIAVGLNQGKWLSWKGTKKDLTGPSVSPGRGFTMHYSSPGLALSVAKLRPTSGEVSLAGGKPGDPPRTPPTGEVGRPRRGPPPPPDGGPPPGRDPANN